MIHDKRVFIADDDRALIAALTYRCKQLGLHVQGATDAMSALAMIRENPPDLILMDVNMPGGNGLAACEMLAGDRFLAPIPVIVLTGRSDAETIRRCERLGAHYFQKGTEAWPRLSATICELLDIRPVAAPPRDSSPPLAPQAEPCIQPTVPKVLVVDDDPAVLPLLRDRLRSYGVEVTQAFNAMQGYWRALKERPDVIFTSLAIAGWRNPQSYSNSVLARLKHHPLTRDIPVIVLTDAPQSTAAGAAGRDWRAFGATQCLHKPIDPDALVAALRLHIDLPAGAVEPASPELGTVSAIGRAT